MEIRVLNPLLIVIVVFQGLCAAFRIPVPKPKPVPEPVPIPKPVPVPEPVPIPDIPAAPPPNGQYPLGKYIDNDQAPFADLTGEWAPFFSKVDDILDAVETKAAGGGDNPNGGPINGAPPRTVKSISYTITNFCSTVAGGNCVTIPTYITVFDPAQPTNACSAWSSLSVYCGGAGTKCACYSGSYYVPDQWNSLAAACAKVVTACAPPTSTLAPAVPPPRPSISVPSFVPPPTAPPLPTVLPPPTAPPLPTVLPPPAVLPPTPRLPPRQALNTTLIAENSGFGCGFVRSAISYASYCPTNTSTVAFAAVTSTPQSSPSTNPAATAMAVPKYKILITALFVVLLRYHVW